MIILVAVCAAIYSAALIAFKTAIPLIPGITEVRIANIFPMVFGLLFGPAGAWGTALGNLIGDVFGGTLGPGSVAGLFGNFLLGYLPYTLWVTLLPFTQKSREWHPHRVWSWLNYILIAFISSASCGVVIGIAVDALGIVPYEILTRIITLNNTLASLIGLALLNAVFGTIKHQFGLFWTDLLDEEEIAPPVTAPIGAWVIAIASTIGFLGGMITDLPATQIGWLSALAILIGSLLL